MRGKNDVDPEVSDNGTMNFSSDHAQLDYSLNTLFPYDPNTGDLVTVTSLVVRAYSYDVDHFFWVF